MKYGEYIRTKNGYIGKLLNYDENDIYFGDIECNFMIGGMPIEKENIKAHSKNIIDLIEVSDYVNGKKIEAIIDGFLKSEGVAERVLCFETDFPIEKGLRCYHNCDIESILTKELFNQNSYKIGE